MYAHILIATDGSELADKGLAHGAALAKTIGAKVTIVTVTELWSPLGMAEQTERGVQNALAAFEETTRKDAEAILERASRTVEAHGIAADTLHVPDQYPAEGIIEAAKNRGCDLIVMASHGRRGVRRLILGSQAAEVLAHTHIPVLIVR